MNKALLTDRSRRSGTAAQDTLAKPCYAKPDMDEKCPHCGANLIPGSTRCAYCDAPIQQAPKPAPAAPAPAPAPAQMASPGFGGPRPGGFVPPQAAPGFVPPGGAPMRAFQPLQPPPYPMPNFVLWIVLGLVQFFVCQISVPAIIGTVMAFQGKNEWDRGNWDRASEKIKVGRGLVIANIALIVLIILGYVGFMVFVTTASVVAGG